MVPRFARAGTSFKGVAQYLTHDAGHAKTADRVAWTHTLNLANDHVPSAVDEMLWTFRNAELLKQEAGLHGGSKTQKPVKHLSLNWAPSERPSQADMIAAAEAFLRHMGWQEHQALIVAHNDRPHPHIHLVICKINPETGRSLNDSLEFRRAQAWALAYEQERGTVFCQQRLKPVAEREPSAPRPVWQLLDQARAAHERAEAARLQGSADFHAAHSEAEAFEWRALKSMFKAERIAFFEAGRHAYKALRNDVYRAVRREFSHQWADLYAARDAGAKPAEIAVMKADLIARQREVLVARRTAACDTLREDRDFDYRALLDQQKAMRATLADRQRLGQNASGVLQGMAEASKPSPAFPHSLEEWQARRAPRRTAPSAHAERPFVWTDEQGMPAQQRAAQRWMERVAQYESRTTAERGVPQEQKTLLRFGERLARRAAGLSTKAMMPDAEFSAEPEPDV